jgi:threonine synthase
VSDEEMREAQVEAGRSGLWQELSSSSSIAGLRRALQDGALVRGPVVCISTSSGFKDRTLGTHEAPLVSGDWDDIQRTLYDVYRISS